MVKPNEVFEKVSRINLERSETLLSGIATAAAVFLVIATAVSAFQMLGERENTRVEVQDLVIYTLRALALLMLLGAVMLHMANTA